MSVLVFDNDTVTSELVDVPGSVLVMDAEPPALLIEEAAGGDFLIFDPPEAEAVEVIQQPDFILFDAIPVPVTITDENGGDFLVITTSGPRGLPGEPGAPGTGGFYQEFSFATPADPWVILHNQNTLAVVVETVDQNGDTVEGDVRYVNANRIEVDWYYPMAGLARVFR